MSKRKQGEGSASRFQRKIKASSGNGGQPGPRGRSGTPDSGRGRRESGAGASGGEWLFGLHPVLAALANPDRQHISLVATTAGAAHLPSEIQPRPQIMEGEAIARRLPPGAVHQGVALCVAPLPEVSIEDVCAAAPDANALVVVLDQVTDPHNVGAILRSAAAFGAKAVVVTERHAPAVTGTLAKAACGGLEHIPLVRVTNLSRALDELAKLGYWRVGLAEEGAIPLAAMPSAPKIALVLGAEGSGMRRLTREHCDLLVRLPVSGPITSLNVSNAAAIALYAVSQRFGDARTNLARSHQSGGT